MSDKSLPSGSDLQEDIAQQVCPGFGDPSQHNDPWIPSPSRLLLGAVGHPSRSGHLHPSHHPIPHTWLVPRAGGAGPPWIMDLPPNVTQMSDSDDDRVTPNKGVVRKTSPQSAWTLTPPSVGQAARPGKALPTAGCTGSPSMAADSVAQKEEPGGVPSSGSRDLAHSGTGAKPSQAKTAASKLVAANPEAVVAKEAKVKPGTKAKPAAAQVAVAKAEAAKAPPAAPAPAPPAPTKATRLVARSDSAAPAGKRSRGPNKDCAVIGLSS